MLIGTIALGSALWLRIVFGIVIAASAIFFVWRTIHAEGDIDASKPGFMLAMARWLRTTPQTVATYRWFARTILPAVFLAICVFAIAGVGARMTFDVMSAAGQFCKSGITVATGVELQEKMGAGRAFNVHDMCSPTGLILVEGQRYRITITMQDEWFDKGIRTDVRGFSAEGMRHYSAGILKRWWSKNWFLPVARIGPVGNYEYALVPASPLPAVPFNQCRPKDDRKLSVLETLRDTPNPASAEYRKQQARLRGKGRDRLSGVCCSQSAGLRQHAPVARLNFRHHGWHDGRTIHLRQRCDPDVAQAVERVLSQQ